LVGVLLDGVGVVERVATCFDAPCTNCSNYKIMKYFVKKCSELIKSYTIYQILYNISNLVFLQKNKITFNFID